MDPLARGTPVERTARDNVADDVAAAYVAGYADGIMRAAATTDGSARDNTNSRTVIDNIVDDFIVFLPFEIVGIESPESKLIRTRHVFWLPGQGRSGSGPAGHFSSGSSSIADVSI